ncbi:MAG: hypothetical protein IJZ02_08435 [Clostridia bacterium]|nr:hypothetical protein [Clostridia bacterium]
MRVLGKFMGGYNSKNFAVGSYVAFEAAWANVETYTGSSIEEDNRCFLKLGAAFLITEIKSIDGEYITPEVANTLVKDIAAKDVLDLDKYNMAFFGVWDIRPDSICIRNEVDEDYNTIPLEVIGV